MMKLTFVTSNQHKAQTAQHVCGQFGVSIERHSLELQEIQADSGEEIAKYKANQAFELLKKPLVITDDSWAIPGLNGFPGAYMKYINHWFTPEDFVRLTSHLTDRRIIMHQIICYQDAEQQKIFRVDNEGVLLKEVRGTSPYPHFTVTSFDGGKHSAAEINAGGYPALNERHTAWHDLCEWLLKRQQSD